MGREMTKGEDSSGSAIHLFRLAPIDRLFLFQEFFVASGGETGFYCVSPKKARKFALRRYCS